MSRDRHLTEDEWEARQSEEENETAEPTKRTEKDPEVTYRRRRFT